MHNKVGAQSLLLKLDYLQQQQQQSTSARAKVIVGAWNTTPTPGLTIHEMSLKNMSCSEETTVSPVNSKYCAAAAAAAGAAAASA